MCIRDSNQNTSLASFAEFTHSRAALSGFMLTLQNVFTGLLLAFVVILLLVSLVVLSHSIGITIEQDYRDMGILKTMGFTVRKLRILQLLQYLTGIPVSYTHLDVYKRQEIIRGLSQRSSGQITSLCARGESLRMSTPQVSFTGIEIKSYFCGSIVL